MAMSSRESGSTIRPTAMEFTFIKMVLGTKANGKMISSMDRAKKFGQITPCMRVITTRERSMGRVFTFGKTDQATMATGMKIE